MVSFSFTTLFFLSLFQPFHRQHFLGVKATIANDADESAHTNGCFSLHTALKHMIRTEKERKKKGKKKTYVLQYANRAYVSVMFLHESWFPACASKLLHVLCHAGVFFRSHEFKHAVGNKSYAHLPTCKLFVYGFNVKPNCLSWHLNRRMILCGL